MWDLSSPTRDRTCTPCSGRRRLNRWTAREVPRVMRLLGKHVGLGFPFCCLFKESQSSTGDPREPRAISPEALPHLLLAPVRNPLRDLPSLLEDGRFKNQFYFCSQNMDKALNWMELWGCFACFFPGSSYPDGAFIQQGVAWAAAVHLALSSAWRTQ